MKKSSTGVTSDLPFIILLRRQTAEMDGETGRRGVRLCVGIDFRAISRGTKLPDHAARSIT